MTGEDDGEQCRNEGKQRKLNVPNPMVGLGVLEDHPEVDTCEPGREAVTAPNPFRGPRCGYTPVHIMDAAHWNIYWLACGTTGRNGLGLNDADSRGKETKSHPLCRRKELA